MRTRLVAWCCGAVMVLSGCGGATGKSAAPVPVTTTAPVEGAAPGRLASPSEATADLAPASPAAMEPPPPSAGGASSVAPVPPSMQGAEADARSAQAARRPVERPGLGTEWGETRSSPVQDVAFFRADPYRPFAMATLHYDDREGVEALVRSRRADGGSLREVTARGGAITISLRGDYGEPLEATHVGDRTYVVGQAGGRYSIVLTNHTPHRFEAVASVDGLDVINGQAAGMHNRGYVLGPYATLMIDGFRQSQDAVAAFRFGRVADSYAAQTGSARNVGVIGVAFFAERGDYYDDEEVRLRETANPFPAFDPRFARPPR